MRDLQVSCQSSTIPPPPPYKESDNLPLRAKGPYGQTAGSGFGAGSGSGPIISTVREEQASLDQLWARIFGRSRIDFPLGRRAVSIFQSGAGLPSLVPGLIADEAIGVPAEIDRRDQPHDTPNVEAGMPLSDREWFERMHPGQTYIPPQTTLPDGIVADDSGEDMSILGDIWGTIDDNLPGPWRGALPGGVEWNPYGVGNPQTMQNAQAPTVQPPVVINQPGVPAVSTGTCEDDPMRGMVYKKVCGQYKWVKQKRRRRKALATQSDLRSLAALKGVLGQGKAFEVWIATHS